MREPTEMPFVSAYLDLRPPADVSDPGVRATRIVARDRLREIAETLDRHGPARESFDEDATRIEELIDAGAGEHERGLAVFACAAQDVFEQLATWQPFDARVEVGPVPALAGLARIVTHEPAVVALADSNSLRLFAAQPGRLIELPAIDDPPDDYTRTEAGGWSQARYQRHVDEHRDAFARRAAVVISRAMDRQNAARLILAGDELAVPRLRSALPTALRERVQEVLRLELRATLDEIETKAVPTLSAVEAADARDAADRLVGAASAGGPGIGGLRPTMRALERGAVLELLLDAAMGDHEVDELVRMAARSSARVTFVPDHPGLTGLGGVGALLRYQPGASSASESAAPSRPG
jgi:peptide chain release factor subunit 1